MVLMQNLDTVKHKLWYGILLGLKCIPLIIKLHLRCMANIILMAHSATLIQYQLPKLDLNQQIKA